MVVVAGNETANACDVSPASEPKALTVGATTSSDARATYSNYGSCLDLFAPGSLITSAWFTSATATSTISGTSMASPHVAGAAALALAENHAATPTRVAESILAAAVTGVVSSAGTGSPNRLLHTMAQHLMELDVEGRCGAGHDKKSPQRLNGRNGYRDRTWQTRAGTVEPRIPTLRQGGYIPELLELRRTAEKAQTEWRASQLSPGHGLTPLAGTSTLGPAPPVELELGSRRT